MGPSPSLSAAIPQMFISAADAEEWQVVNGDWVDVHSKTGKVRLQTSMRDDICDADIGFSVEELEAYQKSGSA